MDMGNRKAFRWLIDGYNLLGVRRGLRGDLARRREVLIQELVQYHQDTGLSLILVFDGHRSGMDQESREEREGITLLFTGRGETADERMARLLREEEGPWVVVSSDRVVRRMAQASGAATVSAGVFDRHLRDQRIPPLRFPDFSTRLPPGPFPSGKLPSEWLEVLLNRYVQGGDRVLVGAGIGLDAAAIAWGDRILLAKTDPVTFVAEDLGAYVVQVNANDIAVMGGIPRWFLCTLLLPEGQTTRNMVESLFRDIARACRRLGIAWCGGHTEITPGLDRPLAIGQMLGETSRDGLVTPRGACPGDLVILTKGIALEGTSILAREWEKEVEAAFSRRFVLRCRRLLRRPGISVVREARVAVAHGRVHAMHDPTEGGLATGLRELARASEVGMRIERDRIPVLPECQALCQYFGLDPLGVIASGALLLCVPPSDADRILGALAGEGIPANVIGEVTDRSGEVVLLERGEVRPFPRFERDEIARLWALRESGDVDRN